MNQSIIGKQIYLISALFVDGIIMLSSQDGFASLSKNEDVFHEICIIC